MKSFLPKVSFALLSAVFLLSCQDIGSDPVALDDLGPQFNKAGSLDETQCAAIGGVLDSKGHCHGGEDDVTQVSWSFADHVAHGSVPSYTLKSTCSGTPGSKPSNPTVEWRDGEVSGEDGCVTVTTKGSVRLTNDAYLIVATKRGNYTLQFQIQDIGGAAGTQYRTHRFTIEAPEFSGAGFTLHVHSEVDIYELKGHTGGPEVRNAGAIYISDIVYDSSP